MESTFIIDCPHCKAKVAAVKDGETVSRWIDDGGSPCATRITVGRCPSCGTLLAGTSDQIRFEDIDSEYDKWSDAVRVYRDPGRAFSSRRIPKTLRDFLVEADRSLQANANIAACVMFGRALEALCRDHLVDERDPSKKKGPVMLGASIKQLRKKDIIDDRLYDWSQYLQAFIKLAAHPDDEFAPSRADTEDLQAFAYAIIEYVYDLTDRYNEFKHRIEAKTAKKNS